MRRHPGGPARGTTVDARPGRPGKVVTPDGGGATVSDGRDDTSGSGGDLGSCSSSDWPAPARWPSRWPGSGRSRRRPRFGTRAPRGDNYAAHHGRAHRRRRPRVELVPPRRLHGGRGLVEAHRRDLRGRAHRRGPGRDGRAGRGGHGARAGDDGGLRPLLLGQRHRARRRARRRDLGHPRRHELRGLPRARPAGQRPARARAQRRGGGALRLPGGGQLDARSPTASCSTSAAARCSSSTSSAATRRSSTPGAWARCA